MIDTLSLGMRCMAHTDHSIGRAATTLDRAIRIYRSHAAQITRQLVQILGSLALLAALYALSQGQPLDWTGLSPLRAQIILDIVAALTSGAAPRAVLAASGAELVYAVLALTIIVNGTLAAVASPAGRPPLATLTGLLLLPIGVLSALLVDLLRDVALIGFYMLRYEQRAHVLAYALPTVASHVPGLVAASLVILALVPLLLAPAAAAYEQQAGMSSLGRSWVLSRGARQQIAWLALGLSLLGAVIMSLPEMALVALADPLAAAILAPFATLAAVSAQAAEAVLIPLQVIAFACVFEEQRMRCEGADLVARTHVQFPAEADTV